jgi:hypothetical protein
LTLPRIVLQYCMNGKEQAIERLRQDIRKLESQLKELRESGPEELWVVRWEWFEDTMHDTEEDAIEIVESSSVKGDIKHFREVSPKKEWYVLENSSDIYCGAEYLGTAFSHTQAHQICEAHNETL